LDIEEAKTIAGKSGMYFILFRRMERERKGANLKVEITWVLKKENLMGTSVKVMSYEGSESEGKKEGREVAVWKR
jgi:hypothetical protein